jgi:hypothetical protein
MHKLKAKCSRKSLLTVTRNSQWRPRMVYILVANKSYKYRSGLRSHIIYIGTTGGGAERPAISAVNKASLAFGKLRGVKTIEVYIVTCRGRKAMKTWLHLESGLLEAFRDLHYALPPYNKKKGRKFVRDKVFRQPALEKMISQFSSMKY